MNSLRIRYIFSFFFLLHYNHQFKHLFLPLRWNLNITHPVPIKVSNKIRPPLSEDITLDLWNMCEAMGLQGTQHRKYNIAASNFITTAWASTKWLKRGEPWTLIGGPRKEGVRNRGERLRKLCEISQTDTGIVLLASNVTLLVVAFNGNLISWLHT